MRRILCLWFPNWTIQRWYHSDPALRSGSLVVLADAGRQGLRVDACCPHAAQQGVTRGMPYAEAKALLPYSPVSRARATSVVWKKSDPASDRQALQSIALDCQHYTPLAGLDAAVASEAVLLDVTGCTHLLGSERDFLAAITRDFADRKYELRTAIADTIGAAWAVAHCGPSGTIVPPGEQARVLDALPVAALRVGTDVLRLLNRLDVRTIAQLRQLPRSTLPSRFGPQLLQRLDQALGDRWESFTPERLAAPICAAWRSDEPLTDQREVSFIFCQLLDQLLRDLAPRRAGMLEVQGELRTESQALLTIPLRLARPSVDTQHLGQLFELACERQTWPGPVCAFRLEAVCIGSLAERQITLLEDERQSAERDISRLVERLTSRLGEQAVLRPACVAEPLPESSLRLVPWLNDETDSQNSYVPDLEVAGSRPWRLLPTPQPVDVMVVIPDGPPRRLCWQGRMTGIAQSWGPERLETGWWRNRDLQRDYYRVETTEGYQYWLFRQCDSGRWFLHGFFD